MLLLVQLAKLFGAAVVVGYFGHAVGLPFTPTFLFALVVQYAGFNAYAYFIKVYAALKNKEAEAKLLAAVTPQGMEVECPCYKKYKEFVPIKMTNDNYYKCTECKKTLNALVSCETVLVTEPIANTEIEKNIKI